MQSQIQPSSNVIHRVSCRAGHLILASIAVIMLHPSGTWAQQPAGESGAPADSGLVMYLCSDPAVKAPADKKLVYGIINGQKTDCMPEGEFLALYHKARFSAETAARDSAMEAESGKNDIVTLIQKGKRDLAGANLREKDLMNLEISGANLKNANFHSADLRGAVLKMSDCTGADFSAAYMKGADLTRANLTNAILKNAYLHNARLSGVKGLTIEQLKTVRTLHGAIMDPALKKAVEEEIPEKLGKPKKCWENNAWSGDADCTDERNEYPMPPAEQTR